MAFQDTHLSLVSYDINLGRWLVSFYNFSIQIEYFFHNDWVDGFKEERSGERVTASRVLHLGGAYLAVE